MNTPLSEIAKRLTAMNSKEVVSDVPVRARGPADLSRAARVGLWSLAIGFGGFLLWAAVAPLDQGVPAPAMVTIDTKRKPVQHLQGGIVKEVLVHEGQEVKSGDVLVRMDDALVQSNYQSVRQRYLGLRAMQGRLEAEYGGSASVKFHPDLTAAAKDPLIAQQMQTQVQLMDSRRSSLRAELQATEESIRGQESMARTYEGMLVNRRQQLALLTEELNSTRSLVKEGYAPRNRQSELERQVADANNAIAELLGNTNRTMYAVAELKQRGILRQNEYRKEVESQLAEVTREVLGDEVKYRAVVEDLQRTEIRATVAGHVMSLAVQSPGSVVGAGQKLMDVVPENEALILEAHVAPHMVDHVHANLPVDIRFSSFANTPQLVVQGSVLSVSSDLITEPQTGVAYFLARVNVTPEGLTVLGKRQLQPGMQAEVVFKTGERTLLTYLLHPLTKRVAASLKEE